MLVLGIDTSCDDTSVAVVEDGKRILADAISSQVRFHQKYGGVVPEIASRKHLEAILPTLASSLETAGAALSDISGIAVTNRPGLVGALIVGVSLGKALAYSRGMPLVGVDHIEAHLYAAYLTAKEVRRPHIGLVVSGGHTLIARLGSNYSFDCLGGTRDDAAGEAYDKVAKMLALGYPGGPVVERMARDGNPDRYRLPRPMLESGDLNFSFSGLKTAVKILISREQEKIETNHLCASFQAAVIDTLLSKLSTAVKQEKAQSFSIVGGVAANGALREAAQKLADNLGIPVILPPKPLCTDNAAMVAGLGFHRLKDESGIDLSLNAYAVTRRVG